MNSSELLKRLPEIPPALSDLLIGRDLGLEPVRSSCPLSEKTRRRDIHQLAEQIYQQIPGAKAHIFAALGNVRWEYLLKQAGGGRS